MDINERSWTPVSHQYQVEHLTWLLLSFASIPLPHPLHHHWVLKHLTVKGRRRKAGNSITHRNHIVNLGDPKPVQDIRRKRFRFAYPSHQQSSPSIWSTYHQNRRLVYANYKPNTCFWTKKKWARLRERIFWEMHDFSQCTTYGNKQQYLHLLSAYVKNDILKN